MQLLTVVIPRFEQLKKEGQSGQTKLTQYTRYLTIALGDPAGHRHRRAGRPRPAVRRLHAGHHPRRQRVRPARSSSIVMTAGTAIVMWLGEQVTERGVGNGMSLLIFTSIAARIPAEGANILQPRGGLRLHRRLRLRPGHHRERRVRRAGPAAHPRAVREADGRPPHVRRHVDLPAAEGEPGRRHPGDLRVVAAVPAAPDLAAGRHARVRRGPAVRADLPGRPVQPGAHPRSTSR